MERYESWFDRARSSYELAKTTGNDFICYEDLCYQIQQSVEKSLKGLLLFYEVEPDFTHNIEILINNLAKFTNIPDNIKESIKLTVYAVQTRYPGEYEEVTKEEYEESMKMAKDCLDWAEKKKKEKRKNDKSK